MSSYISNRGSESLADLDIDELVERLTPGEIQKLLDEADPGGGGVLMALVTRVDLQVLGSSLVKPVHQMKHQDMLSDLVLR